MPITDPLVLAADLVLVPVADLPAAVRDRVGAGEGDWALTRRRARTPSRVVDAQSAALLAEFHAPSTVAEAVLRFCREHAADPEATLAAAFPLLERLLRAGFLVEEGVDAAPPPWAPGEEVAGFEVVELLQGYEDVEVYLVRGREGHAVLKMARPGRSGASPPGNPALVREAAALARLGAGGGQLAPRLLAAGELDGRRWLALEWCPGTDAATAAGELRSPASPRGDRAGLLGDRVGLLALARAVAGAYAALHARGLLHGDVHPRNVRVGPAGTVRLLDFGLARWLDPTAPEAGLGPPGRGGVGFYFEPEYAAAARAGRRPPPATAAGEQHAVAALLYLLLAGSHALDFSLEKGEMLRQIAEEPPLPFAARGIEPWPEVESVLARALAKEPGERFASTAALAAALAAVPSPCTPEEAARAPADARDDASRSSGLPLPRAFFSGGEQQVRSLEGPGPAAWALLSRVLDRLRPESALFAADLPAPRASVRAGAAGIAYGLYRIALAREDPELLALADLWGTRAERDAGEGAFDGPGLPPERVGRISPYHAATGPPCVAALIAHANGDTAARRQAIERAVAALRSGDEASPGGLGNPAVPGGSQPRDPLDPAIDRTGFLASPPCDELGPASLQAGSLASRPDAELDLALGLAGALVAGALLLDLLPPEDPQRKLLLARGEETLAEIWQRLPAYPAIPGRPPERQLPALPALPADASSLPALNLGIAHGWAGLLWATLRWCRAAGSAPPAGSRGLEARLAELADLAEPRGRGLSWLWFTRAGGDGGNRREGRSMPGWCNGSAGFVHLWTLAHRASGDPAHRALAEGAAWNAWESLDRDPTLCCGLAGRAYALLTLWRAGAGPEWLARARDLAERAAEEAVRRGIRPHALYQGEIGVAVLAADLERPDSAAMPFFEEEGWAG